MERQNKWISGFIGVEELLYLSPKKKKKKRNIKFNYIYVYMYQKEQDLTLEITQ